MLSCRYKFGQRHTYPGKPISCFLQSLGYILRVITLLFPYALGEGGAQNLTDSQHPEIGSCLVRLNRIMVIKRIQLFWVCPDKSRIGRT
ncbi:hypothetical protein AO386_03115 [Pseudomonas syringae ICMP 11292]|nr:hypothetical protein AO386_03115 [Pseudomonas syringae ICMP 11292]